MREGHDVRCGKERNGVVLQSGLDTKGGQGGLNNGGVGRDRKLCICEGEFGASSVQDCDNVHCFKVVDAAAGDAWVTVTEGIASVTIEKVETTVVRVGQEEAEGGELGSL